MQVETRDSAGAPTTTGGHPPSKWSLLADINPPNQSAVSSALPVDALASILIVDDEPRNLEVLETILTSPDCRLVRARSAEEALLALLQQQFAAIILDIQMPGTNGFELARLIKERKRSQHIPIILLTAYYQEDHDVLTGYGSGAVDYLTKPVNPQVLKSKVAVFVNLFRTTRALAEANAILQKEITERQKAEQTNARLAAIVECSSDAILSRSLDGTINSWNRAAERILGYTSAEIIGRPVAILVPPDRINELNSLREQIKRGEPVAPFETIRLHKDGHRVDMSVTLSPVWDAAGCVTNISAIMRDISERKRLEAEILQASEREQRRIAHDLHEGLGQQLAGISCLSNALRSDLTGHNAAQAPQAVKISRLLNHAVAHTRSLSRGLHPVVNEPNGLMSALHELAANTTKSFAVSCVFQCPQLVLLEDNGIATHLYRIAQEAVSNAIEHAAPRNIRIELLAGPAHTVLTVNDDGTGFHQSPGRPSGMGLRIMSYRAGVIGGQFSVQKKTGGGTEVVCTIPQLVRQPS